MADKVTRITWEVNAKQLEKLMKTQAAYRKETQAVIDQTKLLASAGQQLDAQYQKQSQAVAQAASEMDSYVSAQQQVAQANTDATDAVIAQANAQGQNSQAIAETQTQVGKLDSAQKSSTNTTKSNTAAWLQNAKTLAFWAIGAASVYRLVIKVRRAFLDTVETLFKNTEEYKRLQAAQDKLKVSFVAAVGGAEDWRKTLDLLAKIIDGIAVGITRAAATINGISAAMQAASQNAESFGKVLLALGSLARADVAGFLAQFEQAAQENVGVATAYLDAYNATIADAAELTKQFTSAGEEISTAKDETEKLSEEQKKYNDLLEKLVKAEEDRIEALLDAFEEYERGLQDIALETQRAFEDLALTGARKREDIEIEYQRKLEGIQAKAREQQGRAEEQLRLKLLRIEMRFRERMIRIQEDFEDSIYSAIQKRDATAALMAIRNRAREEGRARRERADAIELARAEYQSRINEQNQALQQMREDAELWRRRQLEDLRRDLKREREDILLNQQREREDLEVWLARRLQDIENDYEQQVAKARSFYNGDEAEYQQHLSRKLRALQDYYLQVAQLHSMNAGMLASPDVPGPGGVTPGMGQIPGYAQGTDQIFTKPTTIQVAEGRRPERVVVQPITPGVGGGGTFSGTMRHQVEGSVSAAIAGFEGRIGAIVTREVVNALGEMLQ